MKTLTINEREHELSFGIAFIRELDKKFCSNVNGRNWCPFCGCVSLGRKSNNLG